MEKDWMCVLQEGNQPGKLLQMNTSTERFGVVLSEEDAELIVQENRRVLREQRRVEFGEGIAPKIIEEFCDSPYINQENYVNTVLRLQEIFYLYKNEMEDALTDEELLHLMREQFELLCFGDLEYLESTCLANFAQAVRAGYSGYQGKDGYGEYARFDEVKRWDYDLYFDTLRSLCWE